MTFSVLFNPALYAILVIQSRIMHVNVVDKTYVIIYNLIELYIYNLEMKFRNRIRMLMLRLCSVFLTKGGTSYV